MWENADEFIPERFDIDSPVPNEVNTDYRYGWHCSLSLSVGRDAGGHAGSLHELQAMKALAKRQAGMQVGAGGASWEGEQPACDT